MGGTGGPEWEASVGISNYKNVRVRALMLLPSRDHTYLHLLIPLLESRIR